MELIQTSPAVLAGVVGLLGLIVGSFLNVVAYRLPLMMERAWREQCADLLAGEGSGADPGDGVAAAAATQAAEPRFNLLWPPSTCPHCGRRIAPWHNIPVVSYLWLRGRCAACGKSISMRYPIVEAAAALLGIAVALTLGASWATVAALGFTWALLVLTLIDIDHQLLPDSITLPLLWAGLLLALGSVDGEPIFTDLRSSVIGAAAGYLSLWSVYQLFKLVTGKEGMGYGDFKLLGAIGAWLGWQVLPLVIVLSAAVGAVIGSVTLLAAGRSRQTPIPFGPYLAAAGWIAMLWGDRIVDAYWRFMS